MDQISISNIQFTNDLLSDAKQIIEQSKAMAYKMVDSILIMRNWLLGKRIAIEELNGENRAKYGSEVIQNLSIQLSTLYGKGFDKINLYYYLRFYKAFPQIASIDNKIVYTTCKKSLDSDEKVYTVCKQFVGNLSWSHYRTLLQETNEEAREWYAAEAARESWSVRTLQRNISSQYYYRLLKSHNKEAVHDEMAQITAPLQDKLEFIKNPLIAEFLGFNENTSYRETDLENAIISNLQNFIMEMGKGYAWMARQQRIHTEKKDYYIDLVFYNVIMKCYVLIDLKTSAITHQDVGQMDMYVRMYDEFKRTDGDNPTIGILLCADTDDDIARFSILNGNEQLFATKYLLYLPTEEELRREIERQKLLFNIQQNSTLEP